MNKPWSNRAGRSKNPWRLPLVAFLALGLAGVGATAASAAAPAVPFKFSVSGTASQTGMSLALAGTGNASHLGNVSYKGAARSRARTPSPE